MHQAELVMKRKAHTSQNADLNLKLKFPSRFSRLRVVRGFGLRGLPALSQDTERGKLRGLEPGLEQQLARN